MGRVFDVLKMVSQQGAKINTQNASEKPINLLISAALIGMESLAIWVLMGQSLWAIFQGDYSNLVATIFLVGFLFFAGLWTSNIAIGLFKFKRWSYTAGIVLQLLVGSVAAASFAGSYASPLIGTVLLIPSATALLLLFSQSVRERFRAS